jgi:hypothetical protein
MEDVVDFGERVTEWVQFKEWVAEDLIEKEREETPHGEQGNQERTGCYVFQDKYYEITITNIEWNRYDKQYYFIEMYNAPKLDIRQVTLPEGKRPIFKVTVPMNFELEMPYTDSDISPKMFMRVYSDVYAEQALAGVDGIANQGKFQDLNWVILKR